MIITKLQGGLGNQMFQYAIGRRLAIRQNTELTLDLTFFDNPGHTTYRKFDLSFFNIKSRPASNQEIYHLSKRKIKNKFIKFLYNTIYNKKSHILEDRFDFNENILDLRDNVYLEGYWQTEKYFKDIEDIIRNDFKPAKSLSIETQKLAKKITGCNSLSVHIRRGDYISNKKFNSIFGTCDLDYYHEALSIIVKKVKNQNISIFVFSDDINWAKNNFKTKHETYFMDNPKITAPEEMILMGLCKNNIIANSSFSWWGAWLNNNKEKIIVAPQKWFNDTSKNTKDLIPTRWLKT